MKNRTFPTTATALFRPSNRRSIVALLYAEFTFKRRCKVIKKISGSLKSTMNHKLIYMEKLEVYYS